MTDSQLGGVWYTSAVRSSDWRGRVSLGSEDEAREDGVSLLGSSPIPRSRYRWPLARHLRSARTRHHQRAGTASARHNKTDRFKAILSRSNLSLSVCFV